MDYSLQAQFNNFMEGLMRPEGILWMSMLLLLLVSLLAIPKMKWIVVTFMMFVAVLAYSGFGGIRLFSPVNELRLYGRAIVTLMLALLLIPTIMSHRGWRLHAISWGLVVYFLFQLVISMRMLFGGDFMRGYVGALSYTLTFTVIGFGMSRWLQTMEDARAAIRCIVFASIIFCAASLVQYGIDKNAVAWSGRFFGVSGNPNHAALVLGTAIPATLYEVTTTRRRVAWRMFIGAFAAISIVLLIWTSSRTGLLVAVLGTAMLFRLRLGRMALAVICCGVFTVIAFTLLEEAGLRASRLLSMDDTRSRAWGIMATDFMDNPLVGINASEARMSENSYLLIAARSGVMGLIPFGLGVAMIVRSLIKLQRVRRYLTEDVFLADLVTAGIVSLGAGAMFEGFLFGTYTFPLFALFIYVVLLTFLLDYAHVKAATGFPMVQHYEQPPQYAYEPVQMPELDPAPADYL